MKKVKNISLFILLLGTAALISCNNNDKESPYLTVNVDSITFTYSGGMETLPVSTNIDGWTCHADDDWLTAIATPTGIELTAKVNSSMEKRKTYLRITAGRNYKEHKKVEVTQGYCYLTILSSFDIAVAHNGKMADGNNPTVKISTNNDWNITGLPEWITANPTSGNAGTDIDITLTVDDNDNLLRSGNFTINAGFLSEVVTVNQLGSAIIFPLNLLMKSSGITAVTINVHDNYWEFTSNTDTDPTIWIQVEGDVSGQVGRLTFEYQVDKELSGAWFAWFTADESAAQDWLQVPVFSETNIDPNNEGLWETFTFDIAGPVHNGWGDRGIIRLNLRESSIHMLMRNLRIIVTP
jgi:hypothetical protein